MQMMELKQAALAERADESVSNALVDDSWMDPEDRKIFDAALAMVPTLRSRVDKCQRDCNVPSETIDAFYRAGLTRIVQPKRYGGLGRSTVLMSRVVEELAMGCTSSAWVLSVFGEHAWIVATYSEQAQEDVWGNDPLAVAASSLAPRATAERVPGGYRISGTYPFASGCKHAGWIVIGAWIQDGNARELHFLLIPMREVKILEDWQSLGLRGTGSNTVALDNVFVPAHRTVKDSALQSGETPGAKVHPDYPLLKAQRNALAIYTQLPVTLALARQVLHHTAMTMRGRVSRGSINMDQSQVVQLRLGEAASDLEAAILIAHQRHKRASDKVFAGGRLTASEVLACKRDSIWANRTARRAIDTLVSVSSAEIVHDRNELQQWYRDSLTTGSHFGANWEIGMVPYGRSLLGFAN